MMTVQTRWLLAVVSVASVGGAGAWLYFSQSVPKQGDSFLERDAVVVSESAVDWNDEAMQERAPGCSFSPGVTLAYRFVTEDVADLDLSGLVANMPPQANRQVRSTTRARLELQALSSEPEWGSVLVARFAHVEANTIVEKARLQTPFLVRLAPDCSVDGFAHQRGTDAGYARVQQALVHELSWHWPADGEGHFEARRTNGSFVAAVRQSQANGEVVLDQAMTSFEPWSRGPGSVERVINSHQRVVPGQGAWFGTLTANASFVGPRAQVQRITQATYLDNRAPSLREVSRDESDYVWTDLLPHEIPLNEVQPPTEAELIARAQARLLSVDQAMEQYVARVENDELGIQDTWPALQTFLEARPEAAEELIDRMKRRELAPEATMGVYIALGNARTPEAKRALEGVMRDESAPVIERSRAVLALIDRSDVGIDLASYLAQQSRMLASGETSGERVMARQSLLALGAMSGRKPYDTEIKQSALSQIATLLEETRDMSAAFQRPVFGALANVGDPSSLRLVAHIPDHPDAEVREAAAIVFRRMPPHASAEFAARWLAQETNPNVKRHLWQTIELQTFDAREMTSRAVLAFAVRDLRERPGFITRKALIRLLARAIEEMPKDELGIEDVFAELIPFEIEQRSGFFEMMHDHVDPVRRDAIYLAVSQRGLGEPSGQETPGAVSTPSSDEELTYGGVSHPGSTPVLGDRN